MAKKEKEINKGNPVKEEKVISEEKAVVKEEKLGFFARIALWFKNLWAKFVSLF